MLMLFVCFYSPFKEIEISSSSALFSCFRTSLLDVHMPWWYFLHSWDTWRATTCTSRRTLSVAQSCYLLGWPCVPCCTQHTTRTLRKLTLCKLWLHTQVMQLATGWGTSLATCTSQTFQNHTPLLCQHYAGVLLRSCDLLWESPL